MACGIAGGEVELIGMRLEHLEIMVMKLCEMGMRVSPTPDGIWAQSPRAAASAVDIATLPYPGFATDFMPLAVALMAVADGSAIVTENVYDGRFQFVDELARMGADVRTEGRHAIVRGVERLSGAPVQGLRRAGRRRARAGRARGRRRDHRSTTASTSIAATPTCRRRSRALGADVERVHRLSSVGAMSPGLRDGQPGEPADVITRKERRLTRRPEPGPLHRDRDRLRARLRPGPRPRLLRRTARLRGTGGLHLRRWQPLDRGRAPGRGQHDLAGPAGAKGSPRGDAAHCALATDDIEAAHATRARAASTSIPRSRRRERRGPGSSPPMRRCRIRCRPSSSSATSTGTGSSSSSRRERAG